MHPQRENPQQERLGIKLLDRVKGRRRAYILTFLKSTELEPSGVRLVYTAGREVLFGGAN
jgi:hypothetical protein